MKQTQSTKSIKSAPLFQPGDLVQLQQPFRPDPTSLIEYQFGIVSGLVRGGVEDCEAAMAGLELSPDQAAALKPVEVILRLFDPETTAIYRDEYRSEALFSFYAQELLPVDTVRLAHRSSAHTA